VKSDSLFLRHNPFRVNIFLGRNPRVKETLGWKTEHLRCSPLYVPKLLAHGTSVARERHLQNISRRALLKNRRKAVKIILVPSNFIANNPQEQFHNKPRKRVGAWQLAFSFLKPMSSGLITLFAFTINTAKLNSHFLIKRLQELLRSSIQQRRATTKELPWYWIRKDPNSMGFTKARQIVVNNMVQPLRGRLPFDLSVQGSFPPVGGIAALRF